MARAVVIVDVGPELSAKGAKVIGDFVAHNIEFDDLDVFLDNVARYDPFRSREHIARTVKYNLLVRADGKYVSKVDHRRLPGTMREMTLDSVGAIPCPVLVVRGGESDVLAAPTPPSASSTRSPTAGSSPCRTSATTCTAATRPASSTPSARSSPRSPTDGFLTLRRSRSAGAETPENLRGRIPGRPSVVVVGGRLELVQRAEGGHEVVRARQRRV